MCFSRQGGPWIPPLGRRDPLPEAGGGRLTCPWAGSAAAGSVGSRPPIPACHSAPTTPSQADLASPQLFQRLLVKNNFVRARQLPPEPLCNPQAPHTSPPPPSKTPGSLDGLDWKGHHSFPDSNNPLHRDRNRGPEGRRTWGHARARDRLLQGPGLSRGRQLWPQLQPDKHPSVRVCGARAESSRSRRSGGGWLLFL